MSSSQSSSATVETSEERDATLVEHVRVALLDDLDEGFARLVEAYQVVLFSVAIRATGHRADAEDLASETLLRAYRALSKYDESQLRGLNPRPWLLTILRNTRRNQVRDAARRPNVAGAEVPERAGSQRSVEDVAQGRALGDQLAALLARLTEQQRDAVVLRHVVDLPIGEVASVLGCPEGTAKSHVSRGLRQLRALLAEQNHAEMTLLGHPGSTS